MKSDTGKPPDSAVSPWSEAVRQALEKPSGARFYRCALQVNPFSYLKRHKTPTTYADEDSYNKAMVDACKANGIEVIAITDHYRVRTACKLADLARSVGSTFSPDSKPVPKMGFTCSACSTLEEMWRALSVSWATVESTTKGA